MLASRILRYRGLNVRRICQNRSMTMITEAEGLKNPFRYCEKFIMRHDSPSYLCSKYFHETELSAAYLALRAFFIELGMVRKRVSNEVAGRMRFQFWRDAISSIASGKAPRHPVALALNEVNKSFKLQPYYLKRIIDAQEERLINPTHMKMDSLTAYAESTHSTFLYAVLGLRQVSDLPEVLSNISHSASHLGKAQCISSSLMSMPYDTSRGHMVIPADIAAKHGLRQEELFRHKPRMPETIPNVSGLSEAIYDFAIAANDEFLTSKVLFGQIPRETKLLVMPIFIRGISLSVYLDKLEKVNFDPWNPHLHGFFSQISLPWYMWSRYRKLEFWR